MLTTAEWILDGEKPKTEGWSKVERWGHDLNQKIPALPSDSSKQDLKSYRESSKEFQINLRKIKNKTIKEFGKEETKEAVGFLEVANSLILFQTLKIIEHFQDIEDNKAEGMPLNCFNYRVEHNILKYIEATKGM